MPFIKVDSHGVPAVAAIGALLDEFLARAESVKPSSAINPPLVKSDFQDLLSRIPDVLASPATKSTAQSPEQQRLQQFAIIETAVRDAFTNLTATTAIESPKFVSVWNLLDIASILAEVDHCEPALLFWLAEELLDGQTINGCRRVFEFLESRQERTSNKHAKLVILRACNELLRRLSKAEDATFCGRIFIYMFQSFPLGDKSSVNLRGEYHVENVTSFDESPSSHMDVDAPSQDSKAAPSEGKQQSQPAVKALDPDALYPIFWSLQGSFSQPKKLFDAAHFASFKSALEATMKSFKAIAQEKPNRTDKAEKKEEENPRGVKRKFEDDDLAGDFNPKYLTSRDLFELEINDLNFRRNILVQGLIIMDFLLSLTPQAKEKIANLKTLNKSVAYLEYTLSDDDAKWAMEMKTTISDHLRQLAEGLYFHRMVDSVLSRDKNWVRWKCENCPSIALPAVSANTFTEAKAAAKKLGSNKRIKPSMGSLSLDFLKDEDADNTLEKFKAPGRHMLPELASFKEKIADDDYEITRASNDAEKKALAIMGKASKTWRALRIAARTKLATLDDITSSEDIDLVFATTRAARPGQGTEEANFPEDETLVVIVDPVASRRSAVAKELLQAHPAVFARVPVQTTRKAVDGETNGKDFTFLDSTAFAMARDGDQLVEFTENEGGAANYGTSGKVINAIKETGKIPVVEVDLMSAALMLKDFGVDGRYVFVEPLPADALGPQLKEKGLSDEQVQEALKAASEATAHAKTEGFYNLIVPGGEPEVALKTLKEFIHGSAGNTKENGHVDGHTDDVLMVDVNAEKTVSTAS